MIPRTGVNLGDAVAILAFFGYVLHMSPLSFYREKTSLWPVSER